MHLSQIHRILFSALLFFLISATAVSARLDNLIIEPQPPIELDRGCVVAGCSGELCVDAATGPRNSTCMWREEYACLKHARCESQGNGQCGWTYTSEYHACSSGAEPTNAPPPPSTPPTHPSGQSPTGGATNQPTIIKPTGKPLPPPTYKPTFAPCVPRPPCLDSHPACLMAEPDTGWCPPVKPSTSPPNELNPSPTPTSNPQLNPTLKPTWTPPHWPTWKPLPRPLISHIPHASQTALERLKAIFAAFLHQ